MPRVEQVLNAWHWPEHTVEEVRAWAVPYVVAEAQSSFFCRDSRTLEVAPRWQDGDRFAVKIDLAFAAGSPHLPWGVGHIWMCTSRS